MLFSPTEEGKPASFTEKTGGKKTLGEVIGVATFYEEEGEETTDEGPARWNCSDRDDINGIHKARI